MSIDVTRPVSEFRRLRAALALAALAVLTGCVSETLRRVDMTPPEQMPGTVPENLLLDVGVAVFDPNVPEDYDEQVSRNISPEVRRAEANYMAYFLKNLLQSTGNWGAVRVVPRPTLAVDVTVHGRILHSDGERLVVEAWVVDASGTEWFRDEYKALASKYAYGNSVPRGIDPFQSLYKEIADDMLAYRLGLTADEVTRIRTTAKLRFAREFSPNAFSDHVEKTDDGEFVVRRLPAEDDPMLERVSRVRKREYLFIDTLNEYFAGFHRSMRSAYQDWRAATFEEAIALRELRAQARSRTIAGAAAIVGGIAAQTSDSGAVATAGTVGIISGAMVLKSGIGKRSEARIHAAVLQELGASAEAEISPHTIELENQTVSLTGTVEAQYDELRRILKRLYFEDMGLPVPEDVEDAGTGDEPAELDGEQRARADTAENQGANDA